MYKACLIIMNVVTLFLDENEAPHSKLQGFNKKPE
jgi:hypothetical protein